MLNMLHAVIWVIGALGILRFKLSRARLRLIPSFVVQLWYLRLI